MNNFYKLPFNQLHFDHKRHKYFNHKGQEYISVTTFIKGDDVFDAEAIAEKVIHNERSKYFGMDKKDVIAKWKASAPKGIEVHKAIEEYIIDHIITKNEKLRPLVEQFTKLKFRGHLLSEIVVHDNEYMIAGTADIIEMLEKSCWLFDLKTVVSSTDGKTLNRDRIYKFSLQLELYKRLIEKCFEIPCKIGGILWFRDYTKFLEKTRLNIIKVDNVEEDVDALLMKRKMDLIGTE